MSLFQAKIDPEVVINAVITRKDGTVEDLGVIAVKQSSSFTKLKNVIISTFKR